MIDGLVVKLIAGGAAVAIVLGLVGWWSHELEQQGEAKANAAHAAGVIQAQEQARAEEQRRVTAQKEISDETQRMAVRARSDGRGVDAAAGGLRGAVAARLGPGAGDSPAGPGISATGRKPDLLADVLGEAEDRLRALALEADERGVAGLGCERKYDALTFKR